MTKKLSRVRPHGSIPMAFRVGMRSAWLPIAFALVITASFSTSLIWAESTVQSIVLEPQTLDFGAIKPEESPERIVRIKNIGPKTLTLSQARTSCACTQVFFEPKSLERGENAEIRIKLLVNDYPSNKVRSLVELWASSDTVPIAQLKVKADVVPEVTVEPLSLDFGIIEKGVTATATMILRRNGKLPISIKHIDAPPELNVTYEPLIQRSSRQLTPITTADTYLLKATLTPPTDRSKFVTRFVVTTNVKRMPRIEVPVSAETRSVECTIAPRVVVFNKAVAGQEVGEIRIVGGSDLVIKQVTSSHSDLIPILPSTSTGSDLRVRLRLAEKSSSGVKAGKITIHLIAGSVEELREVPFYGLVTAP